MYEFIDLYCERLGPGLWAEPLNALTNLAFLVAALWAGWWARRAGLLAADTLLLIVMVGIIGLGSTAFHTFATHWSMLADTLPILAYQLLFLLLYSHRVLGWPWWGSVLLLIGFWGIGAAFAQLPSAWLNGSLQYAPAFLLMAGMAWVQYFQQGHLPKYLLGAALLFALSLVFRSVDMWLCDYWPWGTHIFWHLCNGGVLYLTLRAYFEGRRLAFV